MNYDKILSRRLTAQKPSGIRRFFDLAGSMEDCITLGVGEPDFKTPWHIREAGINALRQGKTKYTANNGLPDLREEIARYMERRFSLTYCPQNEIVVTVGGSEGIDAAMRALINDGDEVLIPEPSFVCYTPLAAMAGGVPIPLLTYEKDQFRLRPDVLKNAITEKTKLLVLPFPNNPTGAVMTAEDYEKIAEVLRGTDIMVLSDEIYIELGYDEKPLPSFAETPGMKERTLIIGGFSKSYAMTGWRMGYVCGPKPVIHEVVKIHQFGIMSAPTISQFAAVEALKHGDADIAEMREQYNMRRKYLLSRFAEMNIPCFEPKGAFYVFPNISRFGMTSEKFCQELLIQKKVAMVPGDAFGSSGEGFVRISYAYSMKHLQLAMQKLEEFIRENHL